MSEEAPVCKVCGKLCSAHTVQFRWGVAHAGTYDAQDRFDSCSERHADYQHIWGRISAMETVVRSLRWHAGRLDTKDKQWSADDLRMHANKVVKQIEQLIKVTQHYYAWAKKL